jgi:hypothetical protein
MKNEKKLEKIHHLNQELFQENKMLKRTVSVMLTLKVA